MNFDKYIDLCNRHLDQDFEHFPYPYTPWDPLLASPHPRGQPVSDFYTIGWFCVCTHICVLQG